MYTFAILTVVLELHRYVYLFILRQLTFTAKMKSLFPPKLAISFPLPVVFEFGAIMKYTINQIKVNVSRVS